MATDPKFRPSTAFAKQAVFASPAKYKSMHRESVQNPRKFWGKMAKQELAWFQEP